MSLHNSPLEQQAIDAVEDLLQAVIQHIYPLSSNDEVARALVYFLVREANTWNSIRTLQQYSKDESIFINDAAALLRVMFDAYLQAAYIVVDPAQRTERARLYLEFEHVERYKMMTRVVALDHPISDRLKTSNLRVEGERRVQAEYDRVKGNYLVRKRGRGGAEVLGPSTRNKWYEQDLAKLAEDLNREAEYDLFVSPFHGCIHSSALVVKLGPVISAPHVVAHASTIAARVAALCADYSKAPLTSFHRDLLNTLTEEVKSLHGTNDGQS